MNCYYCPNHATSRCVQCGLSLCEECESPEGWCSPGDEVVHLDPALSEAVEVAEKQYVEAEEQHDRYWWSGWP